MSILEFGGNTTLTLVTQQEASAPFSQNISGVDGSVVIEHGLNRTPSSINFFDNSGENVELAVSTINANQLRVSWNGAFTGKIVCY